MSSRSPATLSMVLQRRGMNQQMQNNAKPISEGSMTFTLHCILSESNADDSSTSFPGRQYLLKIDQAIRQSWDLLVFVYFISQAAT